MRKITFFPLTLVLLGPMLLSLVLLALPTLSFGQATKTKPSKAIIVSTNTNQVTEVVNEQVIQTSQTTSTTTVSTQLDIIQELKQEGLLKPTNEVEASQPKPQEGIEYISVYSKEKGLKIYLEAGGGPLVSGGLIWRFNPIFGVGIGGGYTPLPYRNFGPLLDLKAEVVPLYFFIAGDELKMNVLVGLRGVIFFGSMTYYTGINVGTEFLIKRFQYIIPGLHAYLYLAGNKIIPQFSFQLRFTF
jgi:hypothetical protein